MKDEGRKPEILAFVLRLSSVIRRLSSIVFRRIDSFSIQNEYEHTINSSTLPRLRPSQLILRLANTVE